MSWIAEYDTQGREFPTCVHVTKTTGTMTHGATYVPIEDGKVVRAENAKLRGLLEAVLQCAGETKRDKGCDACPMYNGPWRNDGAWCLLRPTLRDLGVEVDG